MANLSDHDLLQMDEVWQGKLSESKVRTLLKRTLEDLRAARDRLNQNPGNSSRPPGSMPPWQCRDAGAKDTATALADERNAEGDEPTVGQRAKGTQPASDDNAANTSAAADAMPAAAPQAAKRAGRPLGAAGHGRSQKLTVTKFVHKYPGACAACLQSFTPADAAQPWTAWDTVELCALSQGETGAAPLGVCLEVTRHCLMQQSCCCGHTTRAVAWRAADDAFWEGVAMGEQRLLGPRLAATVVYLSLRQKGCFPVQPAG
jgi:transposase